MSAHAYDKDAELSVLGTVILRNAAMDEIADVLESEHFGRDHHRRVFRAMRALHLAGEPIDPVTLSAALEKAGDLEEVTKAFVYQLGAGLPRMANIASHAQVVRSKATKRALVAAAKQIIAEGESDAVTADAALEAAEAAIYRLSATEVKSDWVSGAELAAELYPVIEQLTDTRKPVTGLPTGFVDLDNLTRGLQKGDLVLLGARPSMGKTSLALQVAWQAALTAPVAFFSIEMARQPIGLRGIASEARIDSWRMLSGRLSDMDLQKIGAELNSLEQRAFFIDESPTLSPMGARSKLRRLKARCGSIGLVVIDYLQLMAPMPDHRHENKTNQVAGISRMLKILAREFSVPFLVLSQLNRGLERSAEKRPTLSDLRDSGSLEQDADVVLLLHRPEVYDQKPELHGLAELIIGKQRNGPVGCVNLSWKAEQMRFDNWSGR